MSKMRTDSAVVKESMYEFVKETLGNGAEKSKIAILVPNFSEYSGDARVAELQAEELAKEGNEVAIFTLRANIKPKKAKLFVLGMPKSLFWERVYRYIFPLDLINVFRWLPRLKDFDLIICHFYPMNWLAYLAKKVYGIKYVFWDHGYADPELFPYLYERIAIKISIFLTKITVQNADYAVSVSNFLRKELKQRVGLDSMVIYNKIDAEKFGNDLDCKIVRNKYNIKGEPLLLFVGRIVPHKGIHLLIDAFKLVKQEFPNTKLIIVGKHTFGDYSKKLKEISDVSVIFAGYVPDGDLPYYFVACDVYVTCTFWEGFNLPLAEAQACGKPVVAFNIGAHPEIIDEKGILVEPGNIEKFAKACIYQIEQKRRSQ